MAKIGLFYGSSTCYTEMVAEKIQAQLGPDQVDVFNIAETQVENLKRYPLLILGIPTWDYGECQEDWAQQLEELTKLDLSGQLIALFGLGDQINYDEWFLDAVGILYQALKHTNASFIGAYPTAGFQFSQSKALYCTQQDAPYFLNHQRIQEESFIGLAIDEENEADKTAPRLSSWCQQILEEYQDYHAS